MALVKVKERGKLDSDLHGKGRNLLVNGNCEFWQRGTTYTGTAAQMRCDRWRTAQSGSGLGTYTMERSTDVPSEWSDRYSIKFTNGNALTHTADQFADFRQDIEGFRYSPTRHGRTSAQQTTLSFWVKSSLTGQFACSQAILQNDVAKYTVVQPYTISAANTWEKKTVTFAAFPTNSYHNGSSYAARVGFSLGAGSNRVATANTWTAVASDSSNFIIAGDVAWKATNGATWYITGIQLEVGTEATNFDRKMYSEQQEEAYRYYQIVAGGGAGTATGANQSASAHCALNFPVRMRVTPNVTVGSTSSTSNTSSVNVNPIGNASARCAATAQSSGRQYWFVESITLDADNI